jgi:hypothetical protein
MFQQKKKILTVLTSCGLASLCHSVSHSDNTLSPVSSRRQGSDLAGFIQKNLGPHFPLIVVGGGGILIGGALILSFFTSRRGERAISVIEAAERALIKDPDVSRVIRGPISASGSYQIGADSTTASGHFDASLIEKVRARVIFEASRKKQIDEWNFSHLRVEIDRKGLSARNLARRQQALARYGDKLGAASAEITGNSNLDNDDVIVFVVEGKEEASKNLQ